MGQVAPDEDHRCAGRDAEEDHPGDVLLRVLGWDEAREYVPEEEHAEGGHREGLDEPIHHEGQGEPLGFAPHIREALRLDPDHHRVDHQPDEHGHDEVDARPFESRDRLEEAWREQSQGHPDGDRDGNPDGKKAFKDTHA